MYALNNFVIEVFSCHLEKKILDCFLCCESTTWLEFLLAYLLSNQTDTYSDMLLCTGHYFEIRNG